VQAIFALNLQAEKEQQSVGRFKNGNQFF